MGLQDTARLLTAHGKGLLASDESTGTIGKRLTKAGLLNNEEKRREYRELFYTAPDMGESISGAILFRETLGQSTAAGVPFVECLRQQGILPGIKVDEGLVPIDGCTTGETSTRGLDTLASNCAEYYRQGARFAKWRAALKVGPGMPSQHALALNSRQLAQYAAICQAHGLVPIVEPEILIDGNHSIQTSADVSQRVLSSCIAALWQQPGISLEATLIKPQMCIPGADWVGPAPAPAEVAEQTLRVTLRRAEDVTVLRRRVVPPAVPGIMFLSGGQSEEQATINLNSLNQLAAQGSASPWALSFSFGRALQASVLKIWSADRTASAEAKQMASALAAANSRAVQGLYEGPHPSLTSATGSLREDFRGWRTDVK